MKEELKELKAPWLDKFTADVKTLIEAGKTSAERVLNKLNRVVNKAKSFVKLRIFCELL